MKESENSILSSVRALLDEDRLDALYISGTDPHRSEYLCPHWQVRRFVSRFSGSYGEVVITRDDALLWTDTRYFLQAEEELKGSGFRLMKLRVPDAVTPDRWLSRNLPQQARVGVDLFSLPLDTYRTLSESLKNLKASLVPSSRIIPEVWKERPPLPANPIFEVSRKVAGASRLEKASRIREFLDGLKADFTVISVLDDLAWSFNLRGSDVPYNPVFLGYAVIGKACSYLFVQPGTLPRSLTTKMEREGSTISEYSRFYDFLGTFEGQTAYLDPSVVNSAISLEISRKCTVLEGTSIPALFKSRKNDTELEGIRQAMCSDGVAMVRFLWWMKHEAWKSELTEFTVSRQLKQLRAMQAGFRGESFPSIVGYKAHGAIVHLMAEANQALPLEREGVLLVDSGGQYLTGTTDITRTIALGPVTESQKRDFTLVLKGVIALSTVRFPYGTRGIHLDILARQALWQHGLNYGHGTGHGVGHFLNVHEGPAAIRQEWNPHILEPGMVLSNEPGIYRTGKYGIRTENMMVCLEKETTEFGRFLGFETLTLCPVDLDLVIPDMLTPGERSWLNSYHASVREKLTPLLPPYLAAFLGELTAEI